MILPSLCTTCLQCFELILRPDDTALLGQIAVHVGDRMLAPCPRLCGGRINLTHDQGVADLIRSKNSVPLTLTGAQLYQAVNGAGLPDEIPKDVKVLDSLLRANQVVKCHWEQAENRIYLHELHLSNGSVIHLAAGGRGAQVLKITKGEVT